MPCRLLVAFLLVPCSRFLTVNAASGTRAFCGSVSVPVMVPVLSCEYAAPASTMKIAAGIRQNFKWDSRNDTAPPCGLREPSQRTGSLSLIPGHPYDRTFPAALYRTRSKEVPATADRAWFCACTHRQTKLTE